MKKEKLRIVATLLALGGLTNASSAQSSLTQCSGEISTWSECTGTIELEDGTTYVGDFQNGLFDGKGTLIWKDGDQSVGDFKNGVRDGMGTVTLSKVAKISGRWIDGRYVRPRPKVPEADKQLPASGQSDAAQPNPMLIRCYHEQAEAAAAKISQFIKEIESQVGWTTQLPWSAGTIDQRRFDGLRLLRQVPAITELSQLNSTGREQLRVSRLAMDEVASKGDFSKDPKFTEAVAHKVYYGPVYFRREFEPYMTLALTGTRRDAGVSVAEVNLKAILDSVSQMKVGTSGQAYVIDAQGRVIAHPDISLVKRNADFSHLPQLQVARTLTAGQAAQEVELGDDIQGRRVVSAYARVNPVGWLVFVELPVSEATLR